MYKIFKYFTNACLRVRCYYTLFFSFIKSQKIMSMGVMIAEFVLFAVPVIMVRCCFSWCFLLFPTLE